METKYYTVTKIEGEYAYILEDNTENEIFIAMALLPEGVDIGTKLKYEMFSYEIIQSLDKAATSLHEVRFLALATSPRSDFTTE